MEYRPNSFMTLATFGASIPPTATERNAIANCARQDHHPKTSHQTFTT